MMVLLFLIGTFTYDTEGKVIELKSYRQQLRPKPIQISKQNLAIRSNKFLLDVKGLKDHGKSSKTELADILCQFCRLTENITCIERFCNEGIKESMTIERKSFGQHLRQKPIQISKSNLAIRSKKVRLDGRGPVDSERGKVVLADMLCQFCRLYKNITWLCNESLRKVSKLEPIHLLPTNIKAIKRPSKFIKRELY